MKKLLAIVLVALAALSCQNVSLQTLANGISVPLPAANHAVGKFWKPDLNSANPIHDKNAFLSPWHIILQPESPVIAGTEVTVYAIYTGSDYTPGGALDVNVRNGGSPCHGSDVNPVAGILPASPTNGVPYAIGTFHPYNSCGVSKIMKVSLVQTTVGGAPVILAQSNNYIVTPDF